MASLIMIFFLVRGAQKILLQLYWISFSASLPRTSCEIKESHVPVEAHVSKNLKAHFELATVCDLLWRARSGAASNLLSKLRFSALIWRWSGLSEVIFPPTIVIWLSNWNWNYPIVESQSSSKWTKRSFHILQVPPFKQIFFQCVQHPHHNISLSEKI